LLSGAPGGYQRAIRKDPVKVRMAIPAADPLGNPMHDLLS
jgi:hypothetical protein